VIDRAQRACVYQSNSTCLISYRNSTLPAFARTWVRYLAAARLLPAGFIHEADDLLFPSWLIFFAQPSRLANQTVDRLQTEVLRGRVLEYQGDIRKRHLRRVHSPGNTDLQQ
jgi:hypothetical protein